MKTDKQQRPPMGRRAQPIQPHTRGGARVRAHHWQWRRALRGVSLSLVCGAIGVLVVALFWTHHAGTTATASTSSAAGLRPSESTPTPTPTPLPPATGLVRFSDTVRNTKFAVQTDTTAPYVGIFNFVTPTGAQYHGGQASDLQHTGDKGTTLSLSYQGTVQLFSLGADGQPGNPSTVTVTVTASIDLALRQATAELTDTTNNQDFHMITRVPDGALQAVQAYDTAVLAQDWATLYTLMSQTVTSVYTEAQFAQVMTQQVQAVGAITAITITSSPQVRVDTASGLTTFTVMEQSTLAHDGASQTQTMTSEFILEGGAWKFLSSQ